MANWDDELELVSREDVLLRSLVAFYTETPENLRILSSVSKQKTEISLREIDYTITNYNCNNKIIYRLKSGKSFNMALDYKNQLHGFSKKCFDPFCRRQRLFVPFEPNSEGRIVPVALSADEIDQYKQRQDGVVTTIGQMNFFRWAITNEVLDFCRNNKALISERMELSGKKKHQAKSCEVPGVKIVVHFD